MTNNSFELAGIRKTETVISKSKKSGTKVNQLFQQ